jgi:hypothetical protein
MPEEPPVLTLPELPELPPELLPAVLAGLPPALLPALAPEPALGPPALDPPLAAPPLPALFPLLHAAPAPMRNTPHTANAKPERVLRKPLLFTS